MVVVVESRMLFFVERFHLSIECMRMCTTAGLFSMQKVKMHERGSWGLSWVGSLGS